MAIRMLANCSSMSARELWLEAYDTTEMVSCSIDEKMNESVHRMDLDRSP